VLEVDQERRISAALRQVEPVQVRVHTAYVAQQPEHLVDQVTPDVTQESSSRSRLEGRLVVDVEAGVHPPELT